MRRISRTRLISLILACAALAAVLIIAIIRYTGTGDEEHQHVYSRKTTKKATCEKSGEATYTCIGCGDTYTEEIAPLGHKPEDEIPGDGLIHQTVCARCGEELNVMYNEETGVRFTAPVHTRRNSVNAVVVNSKGHTYNYTLFLQNAKYDKHSKYLKHHGCSICAATTLLRAVSPELKDLTPDKAYGELEPEVLGRKSFRRNNGKMPVTLYGISKLFDKYGVKYDPATDDEDGYVEEITEHLEGGDPVIITFARGGAGGLSNSIHTIVLLGTDADGHVIIGDSLHKKSKNWGVNGLIKPGKITVSDMVRYIQTYGDWSVRKGSFGEPGNIFYRDRTDRGYLLVYGE